MVEEKKHMADKKKKRIKHLLSAALILVLIGAWVFLVKFGVEQGKLYVDDALANIEIRNVENHQRLVEENALLNREIQALNLELAALRGQVSDLNADINVFSLDVSSLKSSIEFIDNSVNNSILIQAEIGNKIQELDNRLKELQKSLNILMEAP